MACPRRPLMKPDEATSKELLRMCRDVRAKLKEINTPFMIVHGAGDKIGKLDWMKEVHEQVPIREKGIYVSAGGWAGWHQLVGERNDMFIIPIFDMVTMDWLRRKAVRYGGGGVSSSTAAGAR